MLLGRPRQRARAASIRASWAIKSTSAGRWTVLGSAYLMPGYCDERMMFYLAEDVTPAEGHAELDESFRVNPFDLHDLQVLRSSGELLDAKTLLGLAWAGVAIWEDPRPRR